MQFLGCLLGLLLAFLLVALNLGLRLWLAIRKFLGGSDTNGFGSMNGMYGSGSRAYSQAQTDRDSQQTSSSATSANISQSGKVFADNEGDYVDFEEVKD